MCVCVVGGVVIKKVARKITQLLNIYYQIKLKWFNILVKV